MLNSIKLKNFRKFENFEINIDSNFTIICGANATGKTSILEAIYLLSTAKSPRTNQLDSLIKHDKEFLVVEANCTDKKFKFLISKNGKAAYINDVEYKKMSDYIANLLSVMFSPKDLNLIIGGRTERRKFFDLIISMCDKKYLILLNEYKKILKERNELLKKYVEKDKIILDVITDKLCEVGENIYKRRNKFIQLLNDKIEIISENMNFEKIKIKYESSCEKDYKKQLMDKLSYDLLTKNTSKGPHRDDYVFLIEDKIASEYASQGQNRSIVICLKLAVKEVCQECNKKDVVLLLDDVFAELDKTRQKELVLYLLKQKQTFITTTSLKEIPKEILDNAKILEI